jgi:hypothetical protein
MALMEALLKIKAQVDGEGAINSLAKGMGGLKDKVDDAGKGLGGMLSSAGGLSGALGSLIPLVSGVGLGAMAKGAIDAADNMNDLSQKTGVSVESLSKFQQAADASGTSIEGVGAAMIKLNRNLATGNAGAAEALTALGLSATDASGKLKSTDQVMLEVADKFAKMEDGAKKSAAAQALFGKAGADMIPMLNGGRDAVESLSATMTTKFAKSADALNDDLAKMQAKLLTFAVTIGEKLMPHLKALSNELIYVANGFAALPKWQQDVIVAIGGLLIVLPTLVKTLTGLISIVKAISALKLGATIAGWAGAAGPAIIAIKAAFAGLLAFFTGTLGPALLAFFSGPVGWTVLAVAAVVAMAVLFREPLGDFLKWLGSVFKKGWDGFVNILKKPLTDYFKWWKTNWDKAGDVVKSVFTGVTKFANNIFGTIVGFLRSTLQRAFRVVINAFNGAIATINGLIATMKGIPFIGIGFKLLPELKTIPIPKFAKGGIVNRATLAMVGEGAESEYIIPESKMDKALDRFMVKAQGINAGGDGNPTINITTGPVVQFGGEQYVTVSDMQAAMQATAKGVLGSLRNPSTRISLGLA